MFNSIVYINLKLHAKWLCFFPLSVDWRKYGPGLISMSLAGKEFEHICGYAGIEKYTNPQVQDPQNKWKTIYKLLSEIFTCAKF